MKWIKKGQIYSQEIMERENMMQHAQTPVPVELEDRIRIFFSGRPQHNLSIPLFLDVDKNDMKRIIGIQRTPVLELGNRGSFDEFGIIASDVVKKGKELWMYYIGWQRGISVSYTLALGLAISRDSGDTFEKVFEGPVMDRLKSEPYMATAMSVFEENGKWHNFYTSGIGHILENEIWEPQYVVKHATSDNGIDWERDGKELFARKSEDESNSRPAVIKIDETYHMWFDFRGGHDYRGGKNSYRIGYAWSDDLFHWKREDSQAGIDVSKEGWDSEMICYPCIKKLGGKYYMFYNGNGFGASGFGYAELQVD